MPGIEIVDAKNIIRAIRRKYGYDFSNYALTSFRYALDRSVMTHHLRYPELLVSRILEDKDFFDEFLFETTTVSLELFRDTETWNVLKSEVLPRFLESFPKPTVWFPDMYNHQDLLSLLILLKIEFPESKLRFEASSVSIKILDAVATGEVLPKQLESSVENFVKVFPSLDIHSFLKSVGKVFHFESSVLHEIRYQKQNLVFEPLPERADMIFYRNKLIKYYPEEKFAILDLLTSRLSLGGFLLVGIKENIDEYVEKRKNLKVIDTDEKIYKKI